MANANPKTEDELQAEAAPSLHAVPKAITQDRLRAYYRLQEEYVQARQRFIAVREAFLQEQEKLSGYVQQGAAIRDGTYHSETKVRYVRRPSYKSALIDAKGEAYQQRILNQTSPRAYFTFRVS